MVMTTLLTAFLLTFNPPCDQAGYPTSGAQGNCCTGLFQEYLACGSPPASHIESQWCCQYPAQASGELCTDQADNCAQGADCCSGHYKLGDPDDHNNQSGYVCCSNHNQWCFYDNDYGACHSGLPGQNWDDSTNQDLTSEQCCDATDVCWNDQCCQPLGVSDCTKAADCCGNFTQCDGGKCCIPSGFPTCNTSADCCNGSPTYCDAGTCCSPPNAPCTKLVDCCSLSCSGGFCH